MKPSSVCTKHLLSWRVDKPKQKLMEIFPLKIWNPEVNQKLIQHPLFAPLLAFSIIFVAEINSNTEYEQ